jgi:acetoacetate decarboxylase
MTTEPTVLKGQLTLDRFGASMPVDAPYYQSPPFYYRDCRAMTIVYETDAEAAANMLPEGVELPLPAQASLLIVEYPTSTFGPYNEAILGIHCRWQGEAQLYIPQIVVDTVPPLVGGREIWGFPKKIARIQLQQDQELLSGWVERPAGLRLLCATMRVERPLDVTDEPGGSSLSLRVIPSPEQGQPASLAELIQVPSTDRRTHEAWTGPATLRYETESALDPWHALPVRRIVAGIYSRYDFTLPHGRVVRRY